MLQQSPYHSAVYKQNKKRVLGVCKKMSGASEQLLSGEDHVPSYGAREAQLTSSGITTSTRTTVSFEPSADEDRGKERVRVVARCALIACLATLVGGMNGGFTSSTLLQLQNPKLTTPAQFFSNTSTLPNVFGVSWLEILCAWYRFRGQHFLCNMLLYYTFIMNH